jgi:hypothetical protein
MFSLDENLLTCNDFTCVSRILQFLLVIPPYPPLSLWFYPTPYPSLYGFYPLPFPLSMFFTSSLPLSSFFYPFPIPLWGFPPPYPLYLSPYFPSPPIYTCCFTPFPHWFKTPHMPTAYVLSFGFIILGYTDYYLYCTQRNIILILLYTRYFRPF